MTEPEHRPEDHVDGEAAFHDGMRLLHEYRYAEAAPYFHRAVELAGVKIAPLWNLALCYIATRERDLALGTIQYAIESANPTPARRQLLLESYYEVATGQYRDEPDALTDL